ncbi:cytochrome c oxidase assembly protein [Allostella sp. ATCC 35155]|nr:cytochrome c oxidase assembly protein [Stella sp. ATCC 35155]
MHFVDPLVGHMARHILIMNLAAPALVLLAPALRHPSFGRALPAATLVQLALLWGWHAPAALSAAMHSPALHLAMELSLLLAAIGFWAGVFAPGRRAIGEVALSLLATSKLFCLLGILLVFAPRPLYSPMPGHGAAGTVADALAGQHLAGLLMLIACPVSYIGAAIGLAWRWLGERERIEGRAARPVVDGGAGG